MSPVPPQAATKVLGDPTPLPYDLLRGIIDFGQDPKAELLQNLAALRAEVRSSGADGYLVDFIGGLVDKTGTPPDLVLIERHYAMLTAAGDTVAYAVRTILTELRAAGLAFLHPAEYQYALDQFREQTQADGLARVVLAASTILNTGYTAATVPPVTLKGVTDALSFLTTGIENVTARFKTASIEGDFTQDAGAVYTRYQQRKGQAQTGVLTGYEKIDTAHGGMQPGDLAFILGYTGQMKSTLALNIAYHAAIRQRKNVAFVPLEQSARSLMDAFAVLHCLHSKFGATLLEIPYDRLKKGDLTPDEEALLQEALADLRDCSDYGRFLYKEPDKADVTVGDIRRWAEQKNKQYPLDLLVIDYVGLVNPTSGGLSMRESAVANLAVRECKQLAMSFDAGRGIVVLSPFISNRDGFKEAEKNGGRFSLRAMAWASEAEKSADLVFSVYRDEVLARGKQLQLGNLKARDRQLILDTWHVYANPSTRVIRDEDTTPPVSGV